MKRVCRLRKNQANEIHPFSEPARQIPILGRQLADIQEEEVRLAGYQLQDVTQIEDIPDDCVAWFSEDVVFSSELLKTCVGSAAGEPQQIALERATPSFELFQPFSSIKPTDSVLPIGFVFGSNHIVAKQPKPWLYTATEHEDIRVPPHGSPPHTIRIPVSTSLVAHIHHWMHVLHANLVMLYASRARNGLLGRRNKLGKNVKIHPTALVEGSILDDGAEVEAFATVLQSYVGRKAKIAAHSLFQNCVIGNDCHTLVDTHMRRVVAFSGCTLSNLGIEDVVIGRNVFITTGVGFFQNPPGQELRIDDESVHRPIIGGAIGHDCILGARALMAPGTAIPAGTIIVMRPDEGLTQLTPKGLSNAHMVIGNPAENH